MTARPVFVHAYSGLHPGTGQGAGVIDLPIAREVATGLPYLPGSSLKGVLRDACADPSLRKAVFGPETADINDANGRAGAVMFSDQRLLLFPVRSLAGTMAWVTSPFVLKRFHRDCVRLGIAEPPGVPAVEAGQARVAAGADSALVVASNPRMVVLEDLDLQPSADAAKDTPVAGWAAWLGQRLFADDQAWQTLLLHHLCIVHDDILSFLLDTATEVVARNQLTENKTSGNLWYEEALPAESVLAGVVLAQRVGENGLSPDEALNKVAELTATPLQLGGHATIGRGICRVLIGG